MKTKFTFQSLLFVLLFSMTTTIAFAQPTFTNPVSIPPLLDSNIDTIRLYMKPFTHNFNPSDPNDTILNGVPTWAYNLEGTAIMKFSGVTLRWHTGQTVNIKVRNALSETTTTHWHGAEVPHSFNGGSHQPILSGETWITSFTNLDSASTMWYHPNLHNKTKQHISKGLKGLIINQQATDQIRPTIPRVYGIDDLPLIISDIGIQGDTLVDGNEKRPINIVNGVINPYIRAPNAIVRFRILNGSTRKAMQFGLSASDTDTSASAMMPFQLIATDGGYVTSPTTLTTLRSASGSTQEIVLDLTNTSPGDKLYLRNLKHLLGDDVIGGTTGTDPDPTMGEAFLEIRIIDRDLIGYSPVLTLPTFTSPWDATLADTTGITRRRTINLVKNSAGYQIDDTPFDMMVINDTICEGAKEVWTIHNQSDIAHPFYINKISFRILDIIDANGSSVDLVAHGFNGPKNNVLVMPGWKLRFMAQFDNYPTPISAQNSYTYAVLTHEDDMSGGMMQQFVMTSDSACIPIAVSDKETQILPKNQMTLFPNPATNQLFMKGASTEKSSIRLVDLQGRVVKEQHLAPFEGIVPINIDNMPLGLYIIYWQTSTGTVASKVVLY